VALAAWFCSQGATVVLVPPEQSADLRAYYIDLAVLSRVADLILTEIQHTSENKAIQINSPGYRTPGLLSQATKNVSRTLHHVSHARILPTLLHGKEVQAPTASWNL
jgi:hypothetical protein